MAQQTPLPGDQIPQFMDPLPVLSVAGGSIETVVAGASEIALHMREFKARMLPSGYVPPGGAYDGTWVWGYRVGPTPPAGPVDTYTGPVIVATRGLPTQVRFVNNLGHTDTTNLLAWKNATDQTLHWADPLNAGANECAHHAFQYPHMPPMGECAEHYSGPIPAVPHLHGGDVPPVLDGGPDAWFTSDGAFHGAAYYTHPGVAAAGNECVYRYPNVGQAAPTWFHDHLLGGTRLNVYAGLAGAYQIIDPDLRLPKGLHPIGLQQGPNGPVEFLIPLVIQDRSFDIDGQLYFPTDALNASHPFWLPEFEGDTIAVNGKTWPYLELDARRYRFLLINGSNARAYELFFEDTQIPAFAPAIWQIGTDGGYLDRPVGLHPALGRKLVMLPGERAEIIVDFRLFQGRTLLLRNTANFPYPDGTPPTPGTLDRVMQFRVRAGFVPDMSYNPVSSVPLRTGNQRIVRLVNTLSGTLARGVQIARTRQLTLNEVMGMEMGDPNDPNNPYYPGGPLMALVNNTLWSGLSDPNQFPGGVRPDFTAVTIGGMTAYYSELPEEGTTEVWEIVNLTGDAHPIHTHLTQFQLLNRQEFDVEDYEEAYGNAFPGGEYLGGYGPPLDYNTGNPRALGGNPDITPFLSGPTSPPRPNEAGWKDTVMMLPGEVTRIVVRFAHQHEPIGSGLTFQFDPNALGFGYVWHCHIVDHEDNEMMRPYAVVPDPGATRTYVQGVDY